MQTRFYISFLIMTVIAAGITSAAILPNTAGNVSSKGFTRIDFCQYDASLYAFNGLNLYKYSSGFDIFENVSPGVGLTTSHQWDPADFCFLIDSNDVVLPTGQSEKLVFAQPSLQIAEEKPALQRNYYSTASRYRANETFSNGVGPSGNTIYKLDMTEDGNEVLVVEVSNANSGAIAFDFADNLYVADFARITAHPNNLGNVDIYRISRGQLDSFAEDGNFVVVPEVVVENAVLAGSDSMVIDADYNIYLGSYVGIAKIVPTNDPCNYNVIEIVGDIDHNPTGFPWPTERFCGITADIQQGVVYYGKSVLNTETYQYEPYELESFNIVAASNFSADLDGNGIVDFYDVMLLSENYLANGDYIRGDINRDSSVDMKDFAITAKQWLNMARWY